MDQIYASRRADSCDAPRALRHHHHRQRRRRRDDGARAGADAARGSSSSSAATSSRRRTQNWNPGGGLEAPPLPHDGAVARRNGRPVPAVHALRRRRQHEVLGQRALPAASRGFPGARARGRRLARLADRLRHAGAVLRSRRAAVSRARRSAASIRPSRRAARFRTPPVPHAPAMAAIVERLRGSGLHPSPLPLGLIRPGEPGGCMSLQHLQLVPVPDSREERRRRLLRPAGAGAAERHALDQRAARDG